ncbi:MAG: CotH kinase family protein [Crocinitomicaceae bacterium]
MKLFIFLLVFIILGTAFGQQQLFINEVMGNNNNAIESESYDWVELYNPNKTAIQLKGWYLSDNPKDPKKWQFPNVNIKGQSYFIVYLSGLKSRNKKVVHANFKLNANGEMLVLSNSEGLIIDCFQSVPCSKGISYGRSKDGGDQFERFNEPSMNASNSSVNGIVFSHEAGLYEHFFKLELLSNQGDSILYTEDGSIPDKNSKVYSSKIKINSRQDEIDILSQEQNSRHSAKSFKGNVIRAATFKNGKMSSKVYTKSYFTYPNIANKYKGFNIVSLVTDQNNLFQKDSGLYIGNEVNSGANYNKRGVNWQRQAYVTLFDTLGSIEFDQDIDIRIHGQSTRKYPSKSFRIYAQNKYLAPIIRTTLFNETKSKTFSKLVLKASMGDLQKTVFKDELTTYICRDLNADILDFTPCILFINGEYWGIYNLREFLNNEYISNKYKVDKDSVNIVNHASKNHNRLLGHFYIYSQTLEFSDSARYQMISNYFNVKSVIDYYCANLFFGNTDYLENNNKLWQVGINGKWNQFLFDLDYGWMDYKMNNIQQLLNPKSSSRHPSYATLLFRTIITNPIFKTKFLARMNHLLTYDFSEKNLLDAILLFKKNYAPVMRAHADRWHRPGSVSQWEKKISHLITFAKNRHTYFRQYLSVLN